jgi:hypothetical protein
MRYTRTGRVKHNPRQNACLPIGLPWRTDNGGTPEGEATANQPQSPHTYTHLVGNSQVILS